MVFFEIISRKFPYEGVSNEFELLGLIKSSIRPDIPSNCPSELSQIIQQCWHHDPEQRPTSAELLGLVANLPNSAMLRISKSKLTPLTQPLLYAMKYPTYAHVILSCEDGDDLSFFLTAPLGKLNKLPSILLFNVHLVEQNKLEYFQETIQSRQLEKEFLAALEFIVKSALTPKQKTEVRTALLAQPGLVQELNANLLSLYRTPGLFSEKPLLLTNSITPVSPPQHTKRPSEVQIRVRE